ncbi:MAG TPA: hypothetical protein PKD79_03005 [Candidatus Doudnabacteria bacterium]|nr:hypothetical protein [Candidatus Doudnabacteria bacterium]
MNTEHGINFEKIAEKEKRQKQWSEIAERVNNVRDKVGEGIDEGIKSMVIALNAFGINTSQSCEGHDSHGEGAPYVDIRSINFNELEETLEKLMAANPNSPEVDALLEEITDINKKECSKVYPLLDEFYSNRDVQQDVKLGIHFYDIAIGKLESEGVNVRERREKPPTQQELESYKKEMNAFQNFLKTKYFEEK